jgi:hypothetical protein
VGNGSFTVTTAATSRQWTGRTNQSGDNDFLLIGKPLASLIRFQLFFKYVWKNIWLLTFWFAKFPVSANSLLELNVNPSL